MTMLAIRRRSRLAAMLPVLFAAIACGGGSDDPTSVNDVTPPTVMSTSPPTDATNVAQGAAVTATFSESMDPGVH